MPVYEWICTLQDLKEKGGRLLRLPLVYYFLFLSGPVMCKFSFELQIHVCNLILKNYYKVPLFSLETDQGQYFFR